MAFGAFAAIIFALEYVFNILGASDPVQEFVQRAFIAAVLAVGLTFFWLQFRPAPTSADRKSADRKDS